MHRAGMRDLLKRFRLPAAALAVLLTFVLVLPVIAAAPKKSGTYVGKTSAVTHPLIPGGIRGEVKLYISPTGKKAVSPSSANPLMLPCSDGTLARGSVELRNAKIKNGKFSFKGKEGADDVSMTGTFKKGGKVTGTASYSRPYQTGVVCKSTLTYTAKLSKKKPASGR